jgi:hypothetical protein
VQVATLGDLDRATLRMIRQAKGGDGVGKVWMAYHDEHVRNITSKRLQVETARRKG